MSERTPNLYSFLALLKGVKPETNGQYKAVCPGHNDKKASLSIREAEGKILLHCFASCKLEDILKPLSLDVRDLFLNGHRPEAAPGRQIVATYDYVDAAGKLLFQTVRYFPKDFKQRRPDGKGGWIWDLKGVGTVPYRLPEVLEAIARLETVYVAEGEKDVDTLRKLRLTATCNPMGAGKWRKSYSEILRGADLVIIPDKDKAGWAHAQSVAQSCCGLAVGIRVLELPGPGKDASDWIDAGGTAEELQRLVAECVDYEPPVPMDMPANRGGREPGPAIVLTDTTNAELIAQLYGDRLRYDHLRGRWLVWKSHFWQEDGDGEICRKAIEAARERFRRSADISNLEERQGIAKWAIGSEQRGRLDAAVSLARNIRPIADNGWGWDGDPYLFAVKNGVVDLRTGQLRPGRPEDRVTLHSDVAYDASAKCPRWLKFQEEVADDDKDLGDFKKRAYGYTLTGMTSEQVFFLAHGIGSNGKGIEASAIRHVLGAYAYNAPFSTFELTNRASIPNDLAALERRRFVTSSETNEGARLNEARVKALSGQDPCTARYLHHEFFTFTPVCKIWLAVNQTPKVLDDSYGFWRRVRLIPFNRQFKGPKEDKQLLRKLLAEASGILNWLVEGCQEWQQRGLEPVPNVVMVAVEDYREESDPLQAFLSAKCVLITEAQVAGAAFYKAYEAWADDERMKDKETLSRTAFGRKMGQKFAKEHTDGGTIYHGVGLRS